MVDESGGISHVGGVDYVMFINSKHVTIYALVTINKFGLLKAKSKISRITTKHPARNENKGRFCD